MDAWFCAVIGVWGLFEEGNWSSYEFCRMDGVGEVAVEVIQCRNIFEHLRVSWKGIC